MFVYYRNNIIVHNIKSYIHCTFSESVENKLVCEIKGPQKYNATARLSNKF